MAELKGRTTTRSRYQGLRGRCRKLEVEVAARLAQFERREDLRLAGRGGRALGDAALGGLHGDEVHAIELVTDVAPCVAGAVLDDPHEQQGQPAELNVAAYAV